MILLVLIFAQEPGIKILRACPSESKERRLTRISRNLEIGIGPAQQQTDPTGIVNEVGEVCESLVLFSPIMDGIGAGRRIFNAKIVLLVAANRVIIEAALCTTDLETREYRLTRTAIVRQITTILRGALFSVNVDFIGHFII